jgi:protein-L-isoaspartate(D-aspartate) O-methyltransferase
MVAAVMGWVHSMTRDPADQVNQHMVDRLITEGALWSAPLIAAFRATPRHRFLDRVFQYHRKTNRWQEIITRDPGREELRLVYSDRALITRLSSPVGNDPAVPISSSSQPSLMAQMLEDLQLRPGLRVLEVGAGTGYNAALMAHVVGPGRVISVDVDREVLSEAWDHLRNFPERQVEVKHADGRYGYAEGAPFDRIMVTAATPDLEPAWLDQLAEGGLVLAPLSLGPGLAFLVRGTVQEGVFHGRFTRAAYFMALRAETEASAVEIEPLPPGGELKSLPAPWVYWFDRKRQRLNWLGFIQSLAFFALLLGLNVHYRTVENGQVSFGVSDPERNLLCWFGVGEWHVNHPEGRQLGWKIWRQFLDAGGPWPTEYHFMAKALTEEGATRSDLQAKYPQAYFRRGPRCLHLWQVMEQRERPAWL